MTDKIGVPGGSPRVPATSVFTDGETITGNGTEVSPLVATGGNSEVQSFTANVSGLLPVRGVQKGAAMEIVNGSFDRPVSLCGGDDTGTQCVGLSLNDTHSQSEIEVQYGGVVTLTEDEWDAITGQSGGLTPFAYYFIDEGTAGNLATAGLIKIGQAFSSTELFLSIMPAT